MSAGTSRRSVLLGGGGLVVAFSLSPRAIGKGGSSGGGEGAGPKTIAPGEPGDLSKFPLLDSWIRIDPQGRATVFTGKVELGQGIKTALVQLAADELDLQPSAVDLVTADTGRTVDEGVTAGSHSMQDSGAAILNAAADVRLRLAEAAAARWNLRVEAIATADGRAHAPDGRSLSYGELAAGLDLHVAARPNAPRKAQGERRLIGTSLPRVDIPAKLTGGSAYVQDLRLPGMLYGRVLRGPSFRTTLKPAAFTAAERTNLVRLVRDGRFAAVLAERQWDAVRALQAAQAVGWERVAPPIPLDIHAWLEAAPSEPQPIFDYPGPPPVPGSRRLSARYTRPYLMHGSIGPSCATALWESEGLTVWTHSQGVFPLQRALADLLRTPAERIRCIHLEGAGCYGHNGADDVAADAALAARAVPGRPVQIQWTREQEHGWEPLGPAEVVRLEATLDPLRPAITSWRHQVWSNEHNSRPQKGGGLLAGAEVQPSFSPQPQKPIPMPEGGAARNGNPLYNLPHARGVFHWVREAPVRVSALRGLGAHMNVFAIESFMDELALATGADPVAFRLAHMQDGRAREVIAVAANRFGWRAWRPATRGRGRGFAFARYKNLGAYCAVALDIEVARETGEITVHRAVAAVDSGEAVNPDGIRNQVEGGMVQALSWTTQEAVAFDADHRTSFDWSEYPILRFPSAPKHIEVHILDRPGQPFLGTGEAAQGPTGAALANAVSSALVCRVRDMPLSPERLRVDA